MISGAFSAEGVDYERIPSNIQLQLGTRSGEPIKWHGMVTEVGTICHK